MERIKYPIERERLRNFQELVRNRMNSAFSNKENSLLVERDLPYSGEIYYWNLFNSIISGTLSSEEGTSITFSIRNSLEGLIPRNIEEILNLNHSCNQYQNLLLGSAQDVFNLYDGQNGLPERVIKKNQSDARNELTRISDIEINSINLGGIINEIEEVKNSYLYKIPSREVIYVVSGERKGWGYSKDP